MMTGDGTRPVMSLVDECTDELIPFSKAMAIITQQYMLGGEPFLEAQKLAFLEIDSWWEDNF